jgi:hypothetical protein
MNQQVTVKQFSFDHLIEGGALKVHARAEILNGMVRQTLIEGIYYKREFILETIRDLNPLRFTWIKTEALREAKHRFEDHFVNAALEEY